MLMAVGDGIESLAGGVPYLLNGVIIGFFSVTQRRMDLRTAGQQIEVEARTSSAEMR